MSVLKLEQLQFSWNAEHQLKVPQLHVEAGEKVMLQGESGSGKTTLMNLIAGVLTPTSGSIHLCGNQIQGSSQRIRDRYRADHIGIVFQQFNLLPFLSVLENVTLPLTFAKERAQRVKNPDGEAKALLAELELPSALHHRPVHQLSVGQQQRVAAARALLGAPELILADEPTSALDPDNRDRFIQLLQALCQHQGAALLLISHDPQLAPMMDRHYRLNSTNNGSEVQPCGL